MTEWSALDEAAMARALEVAEHGRGRVSPNPLVGCVLVRDGEIVAEGWHDRLGGLHAEQAALAAAEAAGRSVRGATAYTTLEPCHHEGRTPSCTEALLWAGVAEVVIAHSDPNPAVAGEGGRALEAAGLAVRTGLMEAEAAVQMQPFLAWCATRRPLVTLKVATDRHGVVDRADGAPGRFTSPASLDLAHRLRRSVDAILVGAGTVIRDDPRLDVRRVEPFAGRHPLRVVLDPQRRVPVDARMFSGPGASLRVHAPLANDGAEGGPEASGTNGDGPASVVVPRLAGGGFDLAAVLDVLGARYLQELLIEGGPATWAAWLDAGLVDRLIHIEAAVELGEGPAAPDLSTFTDAATLARRFDSGGDTVTCWTRSDLPWPGDTWP